MGSTVSVHNDQMQMEKSAEIDSECENDYLLAFNQKADFSLFCGITFIYVH